MNDSSLLKARKLVINLITILIVMVLLAVSTMTLFEVTNLSLKVFKLENDMLLKHQTLLEELNNVNNLSCLGSVTVP